MTHDWPVEMAFSIAELDHLILPLTNPFAVKLILDFQILRQWNLGQK